MFYSYTSYFFSLKPHMGFGQSVLHLVRSVLLLVVLIISSAVPTLITLADVKTDTAPCSLTDSLIFSNLVNRSWAEGNSRTEEQRKQEREFERQASMPLSDLIPVDAPYAFGYDPVLSGRQMTSAQLGMLNDWWALLQRRAQETKAGLTDEEQKAWQEFSSLSFPKSPQDWSNMGFDRVPRFWIYGLGLTPALVLEVPSPKRLHSWIKHHMSEKHLGFKEIAHSNGSYWRKRLKRWTLLARLHGRYVHFAMIPQAAEPVLLSFFLRNRHAQNLTANLRRLFAYLPQGSRGSGMIQLNLIIDLFFGSQRPLLKFSGEALGLPTSLFASCSHDLRSVGAALPSLTLGLSDRGQGADRSLSQSDGSESMYQIYTHLEIDSELWRRLQKLQENTQPIWVPKTGDALGMGLRFNLSTMAKFLLDTAQTWRQNPWSCRPMKGLNQFTSILDNPQFNAFVSLMGDLSGVTYQIYQESRVSKPGLTQPDLGSMFTGWIELIHPNPSLVLTFLYSSIVGKSVPPNYLKSDRIIHDVSDQFSRLPSPMLSVHPDRIIFSIGRQGHAAHQQLRVHVSDKLKSSRPLIWVETPAKLGEWLKRKLSSNTQDPKYKSSSKSATEPSLKSPQTKDLASSLHQSEPPQFRSLKIYLNESGFMIESTLVVKSL